MPASVGDAAGKDGDHRGDVGIENRRNVADLLQGKDRGDVQLNLQGGQLLNHGNRMVAARVGDRDFDKYVVLPVTDFQCLAPHFREFIRKNFE